MTLEGLADALHVSVEWLKGETDEYETDITDKRELQIREMCIRDRSIIKFFIMFPLYTVAND